jgi:hypothetical protein
MATRASARTGRADYRSNCVRLACGILREIVKSKGAASVNQSVDRQATLLAFHLWNAEMAKHDDVLRGRYATLQLVLGQRDAARGVLRRQCKS